MCVKEKMVSFYAPITCFYRKNLIKIISGGGGGGGGGGVGGGVYVFMSTSL